MHADEEPKLGVPFVEEAAPSVRLVVSTGPHEGKSIDCRRIVTLIGSRAGCKVRLKHPKVSPVHVAIVNDGRQAIGFDLVSRRGTLLNGLKMEHEPLGDGDALTVQPWEFRIETRMLDHEGDADVHPFDLEPTPRSIVLEHVETGRIMKPTRDLCILGRSNGCDVVISDTSVSRVHALLMHYFGRPAICDLLSQTRTLVNDEPISLHFLQTDDIITVGDSRFKVRLVSSSIVDGGDAVETTVALSQEEGLADLIDIQATEASQPWRIADKARKASKKR